MDLVCAIRRGRPAFQRHAARLDMLRAIRALPDGAEPEYCIMPECRTGTMLKDGQQYVCTFCREAAGIGRLEDIRC